MWAARGMVSGGSATAAPVGLSIGAAGARGVALPVGSGVEGESHPAMASAVATAAVSAVVSATARAAVSGRLIWVRSPHRRPRFRGQLVGLAKFGSSQSTLTSPSAPA